MTDLTETIDPDERQTIAWDLAHRIGSLASGSENEDPHLVLREIANLANQAYAGYPDLPDFYKPRNPAFHEWRKASVLDNPAAPVLLAFLLRTMSRFAEEIDDKIANDPTMPTRHVREAIANAFYLTRDGSPGRRPAAPPRDLDRLIEAFERARTKARKAGLSEEECEETGLRAAVLARTGDKEYNYDRHVSMKRTIKEQFERHLPDDSWTGNHTGWEGHPGAEGP